MNYPSHHLWRGRVVHYLDAICEHIIFVENLKNIIMKLLTDKKYYELIAKIYELELIAEKFNHKKRLEKARKQKYEAKKRLSKVRGLV